jgi:hypothetical protein
MYVDVNNGRNPIIVLPVNNAPEVIPPKGGIHAFVCAGCRNKDQFKGKQPGFRPSPE